MTKPGLEPASPLQQKLAKASTWSAADLAALRKERKDDALAFLAAIAETRDVVGSPMAYELLHPLLFELVDRPRIDVEPLVPLLRRIVAFPAYNPGGTFRYEAVRNDALRLLARRRDPETRGFINRCIGRGVFVRDRTDGPALVQVLAEAATELGAPERAPLLREQLATMLLGYAPAQRRAAVAEAEAAVARLARAKAKPLSVVQEAAEASAKAKAAKPARAKGAKPEDRKRATAPKPSKDLLRGVALVEAVMARRREQGEKLEGASREAIEALGFPPSPALRRWLEHDGALFTLGAPEPLVTLLEREVGVWAEAFAPLAPYLTGPCVVFEGWGADSRRILYLGSTDALGEPTVLTLDTDDTPYACVNGPVDVWLAQQVGYLDDETEYGGVPKAYEPVRREHAARVLGGYLALVDGRFSKRLG